MAAQKIISGLCAAALALAAGTCAAANIQTFSPQGEIRTVRQVAARFSESMVKFGDKNAPHPFTISCSEPGHGRWIDDRNWVYDFERDLGPGTRCSFKLKAEAKPLAGGAITGKSEFVFNTGGPAVLNTQPYTGSEAIDEEQAFLLYLNGPAHLPGVREHAYCVAEGVGERIASTSSKARRAQSCSRRCTAKRKRQRPPADRQVPAAPAIRRQRHRDVGQGIETAGADASRRVATSKDQPLKFRVRPEFRVSFTCVRENAQAPCRRTSRCAWSSPATWRAMWPTASA